MAETARVDVEAAGRTISVSNPQKVFFPERGETKIDLIRYFLAVEEPAMRALGGRPVLLERYPDGAGGSSFFQKRVPKNAPDWLETTTVQTPNGTPSQALVAADVAHLVWAINFGPIGMHVWPYHADDPDHADELRLDIDPSPGVTFAMVQEAAARCGAARRVRHRGRPEDHGAKRHPRLRAAGAPITIRMPCAPPRSPSPGSSSGAGRT